VVCEDCNEHAYCSVKCQEKHIFCHDYGTSEEESSDSDDTMDLDKESQIDRSKQTIWKRATRLSSSLKHAIYAVMCLYLDWHQRNQSVLNKAADKDHPRPIHVNAAVTRFVEACDQLLEAGDQTLALYYTLERNKITKSESNARAAERARLRCVDHGS